MIEFDLRLEKLEHCCLRGVYWIEDIILWSILEGNPRPSYFFLFGSCH